MSTIKDRSREGSIHPPTQLFERVGKLTFQQLSDLRHRGAFTTVALTFATCCQMTKGLPETEGEPSILDVWYQVRKSVYRWPLIFHVASLHVLCR